MPRIAPFLALLPGLFLTLEPAAPRGDDGPTPADVEAQKQINAADLKKDLTYLASDALEGRATGSPGQRKAAEYIQKRFQELNLQKYDEDFLQPVTVMPRRKSKDSAASAPAIEAFNVVGVLKGTDAAAKAIVFSAHYDHLGRGRPADDGDDIYNGADDDASGTVAVMALAKAYTSRKVAPKRTIVFACFTGEEIGGFGSRAYVSKPAVPLEQTLCDINLEMLGRTHDIGKKRAWVTGWDVSTLGPILAKGGKFAGVEIYQDPYPEENYYLRSDNVSFVRKGVIGQTVSAGSNHPQYHTPKDEAVLIDFENLESLVRGVYLGSATIANGLEEPRPTGDSLTPGEEPRQPEGGAGTGSKPAGDK
jgi:Zn-dependent M28 family amino/carboxypeptidase